MKLYSVLFASSLVSGLYAQGAPSQAAALKQAYTGIKNDIMQAAEKMPDSDYTFQPTMPERSFGGWVAHVTDAQMGTCGRLSGSQQQVRVNPNGTKADLVAALKQSFEACDAAYDGTTDTNATEAVPSFRGQTTRLAALWGNIGHDQECYGTMAVYLRLKGVVPPSTEMMEKMRGRGKKKE